MNLPIVESTSETEQSIKTYLLSTKLDMIEGIYKSMQVEGMPYYKFGIIKLNEKFKAIILESNLKQWKPGEVKAYFEPSSIKGVYSVKWYMGNKIVYETFGNIDTPGLLTIDLKDQTGQKRQDNFIKMFPPLTSDNSKPQESIVSGSGFYITTDGVIGTNAHLIENANKIVVLISNEIGTFEYLAKVILSDKNNDVAILKITDPSFKGLSNIPYTLTENAEVGEKVFTIGYPLNDIMGSNFKVTDGIISSKTGIADDIRYYQITVPLQPGNSGGPLFNKGGNIIGITSAKLNSQAIGTEIQNVNYAIKIAYLINLFKMLPGSQKINTNANLIGKELQDQVKILKNYGSL